MSQQRRYLIVGPSWVGDMVMAQSLCIDLKTRFPNASIDMLAPQWTAALVDRMPEVEQLIPTQFTHGKLGLGERWNIGKSLRAKSYTHAIVLPNSLKSALVPAFAKIPLRTGFLGEQRWALLTDVRKLDKKLLPMTVERFVVLGRNKQSIQASEIDFPTPRLSVNEAAVSATRDRFNLVHPQPVLALCPGAEFGSSKRWPAKHFAQVAEHYLERGWLVWMFGSANDIGDCQRINDLVGGRAKMLAGETSLPEAVDLISVADLVISNDSGLMHIAAGLNRPLVAVYGSTDPMHTPPLNANHRIAQREIECSPCFKRECPLHHHDCMNLLGADKIIELAEELLT